MYAIICIGNKQNQDIRSDQIKKGRREILLINLTDINCPFTQTTRVKKGRLDYEKCNNELKSLKRF